MDGVKKSKSNYPRAFLDDSLEEEAPDILPDTSLASHDIGGGEKNPAIVGVGEVTSVLPKTFLDDSLEDVESDASANCDFSVPSLQLSGTVVSEPTKVAALEPKMATAVDKANRAEHSAAQASATKVMPVFGKKKTASLISEETKKPMSKGLTKSEKGKIAITAEADNPVEGNTEKLCHSPSVARSLEDATRDPLHAYGKEGTVAGSCSNVKKKVSTGEIHKKKKQNLKQEQEKKVPCKQLVMKEKQVLNRDKIAGEKKCEQEKKKQEREKKKAEKEEKMIEKELRMIEREFNRLEKESRAKKQDMAGTVHVEAEFNEKNEFHISNVEEGPLALEPNECTLCVIEGDATLSTQEGTAVADEAAIPREGARLDSEVDRVDRGENGMEGNGGDLIHEAAVPMEESHVSPCQQLDAEVDKVHIPTNNSVTLKPSLPARNTPQKAPKGLRQTKRVSRETSSQDAVHTRELSANGQVSTDTSTSKKEGSNDPSTEMGGTSNDQPTARGGTSNSDTANKRASTPISSGGPSIVACATGEEATIAAGGGNKKISALKKVVFKSATNKLSAPKSSAACIVSAKQNKKMEHEDTKLAKKFIGKRKRNDGDLSPARKKTKAHNSHNGPVWVQCDDCKKWRMLKECHDPCEVPEKWVCSMNKDEAFNSCKSQEEDVGELRHSQEFIYSPFVLGSVVWAKMSGYPWWPAMIDEDPDEETCYEFLGDDVYPVKYHVVFFGKPVTRAWLQADGIRPFSDSNMNDGSSVSTSATFYRIRLFLLVVSRSPSSTSEGCMKPCRKQWVPWTWFLMTALRNFLLPRGIV